MRSQIKLLTSADLKALEQLRRVALRRCRASVGCPRCGGDEAHFLVDLNPDIVLQCPRCGEVWREGEDSPLTKLRVLYERAVEGVEVE